MPGIGVIAGSGLYEMEGVRIKEIRRVNTPFGLPSDGYHLCEFDGIDVAFLPRHGAPHRIPPHKVNYRANIYGFRELGIDRIISVGATGGLKPSVQPGSLVLLDQVVDLSSGRESTFYDGPEVVHIDFTEPYCNRMRGILRDAAASAEIQLRPVGTYICTNGPRLESAAEVRMLAAMGGDVVGMTGMPEAALARELEICFSSVAVVTNLGAGITGAKLTSVEVIDTMRASTEKIRNLLRAAFPLLAAWERDCACREALKGAKM
ncbi:MAG: S-methyl-5'-thioadenosine phosphorylase [Nitrospirae bacterium]|nr:S-methyl-5'-thioadenosine phosphorylase [Nitrospirota bacterium]